MLLRASAASILVTFVLSAQTAPAPPANSAPAKTIQAATAAARQTSAPDRPIRVEVNEVVVPVTVTDDKGRFVSNLEASDFRVFDEGREQKIQFFTRERGQPVVVGFLIDQSNASRVNWKQYQDAAIELVLTLLPGDKKYSGYLIGYSNDAELLTNTTTDPEKIVDRIRKMKPGGGAALYDAIWMACTNRALVKGEPIEPRRVLVIIGDGHDNASKKTLSEAMEIAQRNLVTVYGVSTVGYGFTSESEKNLTRLAEETGGRVEYPLQNIYSDVDGYLEKPSDEGNYALKVGTGGYASKVGNRMFKAIANVAGEVTTQYILRYVPDGTGDDERRFRNIEVKVNLANVKIRTRRGYYPQTP
ncbi:MAG TPA: VWA domain-containing protein [Bryobacteraceae bacterium]|nr:VWA domain-containing protein [Bryobacteraceae bacterium]